jgi:hypothetical protein
VNGSLKLGRLPQIDPTHPILPAIKSIVLPSLGLSENWKTQTLRV